MAAQAHRSSKDMNASVVFQGMSPLNLLLSRCLHVRSERGYVLALQQTNEKQAFTPQGSKNSQRHELRPAAGLAPCLGKLSFKPIVLEESASYEGSAIRQ